MVPWYYSRLNFVLCSLCVLTLFFCPSAKVALCQFPLPTMNVVAASHNPLANWVYWTDILSHFHACTKHNNQGLGMSISAELPTWGSYLEIASYRKKKMSFYLADWFPPPTYILLPFGKNIAESPRPTVYSPLIEVRTFWIDKCIFFYAWYNRTIP